MCPPPHNDTAQSRLGSGLILFTHKPLLLYLSESPLAQVHPLDNISGPYFIGRSEVIIKYKPLVLSLVKAAVGEAAVRLRLQLHFGETSVPLYKSIPTHLSWASVTVGLLDYLHVKHSLEFLPSYSILFPAFN